MEDIKFFFSKSITPGKKQQITNRETFFLIQIRPTCLMYRLFSCLVLKYEIKFFGPKRFFFLLLAMFIYKT